MKHNVYDFDETIYNGDSTFDFYRFCLKKHPVMILEYPLLFTYCILFVLGLSSQTKFKEKFYRFLKYLKDVDDLLIEFWNINQVKIKEFYRKNHQENDIVISASPEFLLIPICRSLNISYLFASNVDKRTGKYTGENCKGKEKVRRLREALPDAAVGEFYSDSPSDTPLAEIAEKAYLVKGTRITPWDFSSKPSGRMS